MSRHAVIAERGRILAAAARAPQPSRRMARRRALFIRAERLSLPEITSIPPDYDPGPDYDYAPDVDEERNHA